MAADILVATKAATAGSSTLPLHSRAAATGLRAEDTVVKAVRLLLDGIRAEQSRSSSMFDLEVRLQGSNSHGQKIVSWDRA
jgi:hypothetical protein